MNLKLWKVYRKSPNYQEFFFLLTKKGLTIKLDKAKQLYTSFEEIASLVDTVPTDVLIEWQYEAIKAQDLRLIEKTCLALSYKNEEGTIGL